MPGRQPSAADGEEAVAEAVRRYLSSIDGARPQRRAGPSVEALEARLRLLEDRIAVADPLSRVHLIQERLNVRRELDERSRDVEHQKLEAAFVAVAAEFGRRHGLSYEAWRAAGVSPAVLRQAHIRRTRRPPVAAAPPAPAAARRRRTG
ncbi:MAG TPA: hypothetical protein VKV25_07995 [Acidimicrobiales bacterium]|nr:hypothetical protein [Acidimicrobiales bacterium]